MVQEQEQRIPYRGESRNKKKRKGIFQRKAEGRWGSSIGLAKSKGTYSDNRLHDLSEKKAWIWRASKKQPDAYAESDQEEEGKYIKEGAEGWRK